jgi:hypothetical protein
MSKPSYNFPLYKFQPAALIFRLSFQITSHKHQLTSLQSNFFYLKTQKILSFKHPRFCFGQFSYILPSVTIHPYYLPKNYPASPKFLLTHLQIFIYHSKIAYIHLLPSLPRKNYPKKFTLVYYKNRLPIKEFFFWTIQPRTPSCYHTVQFFLPFPFSQLPYFSYYMLPLPYNPTPASILEFLSKTNIYIKIPSPHSYSAFPPPPPP